MTAGDAGEWSEAWFRRLFDDHYADLRRFALRRIENRSAVEDVLGLSRDSIATSARSFGSSPWDGMNSTEAAAVFLRAQVPVDPSG